MRNFESAILLIVVLVICPAALSQSRSYYWYNHPDSANSIEARIAVPPGFERVRPAQGTFACWLQHLPLKSDTAAVHLYDGRLKPNQHAHYAVVDIDVEERDLQQCADAIIRLRAEFLYSLQEYDKIHFKFTSGHPARYRQWIDGYRPVVDQARVNWLRQAGRDSSYAGFREYLSSVFAYAGTFSLSGELTPVGDISHLRIGDVFIQGGFPGHAVIVVDMATNKNTGKTIFLLAQSYTPAQDIHILKNPRDGNLCPWYDIDFDEVLITPEWTFKKTDLKRF